jgi:hypothetical protein
VGVTREPVADDALLKTYRGGLRPERWGKYGDCFSVTVDRVVSLADFVFAFLLRASKAGVTKAPVKS